MRVFLRAERGRFVVGGGVVVDEPRERRGKEMERMERGGRVFLLSFRVLALHALAIRSIDGRGIRSGLTC